MCVCVLAGLLVDHSGMKPDRPPDSVMDVSVCASVTGGHRRKKNRRRVC